MTRSATPASPLRCIWVSTRSGESGLEMRWVVRPDPALAERGDQPGFPMSIRPGNGAAGGHVDPSRVIAAPPADRGTIELQAVAS